MWSLGIYMNFSLQKQHGVVLFFSLIILVIMTVIGVALAVNSTQSLRMAGAGSERIEAMMSAHGAQEKIIAAKQGKFMANMPAVVIENDLELDVVNTITPMSPVAFGNSGCQRDPLGNGTFMGCRAMEVSSTASFGRNDLGQVTVVAGVEQQIINF
jgi:type IV pilus assembly protein PilX